MKNICKKVMKTIENQFKSNKNMMKIKNAIVCFSNSIVTLYIPIPTMNSANW